MVLLSLSACAVDRGARSEIADLRRQVDSYRRQADVEREKSDELENKLFVCEDKNETRTVVSERGEATPRLPVVKKDAPDDRPASPSSQVDRYTDENGEEVVVIYEGDAARNHSVRPKANLGGGNGDMIPVEPVATRSPPRARRAKPERTAAPVESAAPEVSDGAIGLYKSSYQALTRREHQTAIDGFHDFLTRYPGHDHADNAQYWLGEAYYDQRDYQVALAEFRKVVKRYPDGNKAPDALLKIGYCYAKLGDAAAARDVLSQVVEIYPKTEAAKLAGKRLDEMRPTGGKSEP
jgi:tol-pal system protein YbgF